MILILHRRGWYSNLLFNDYYPTLIVNSIILLGGKQIENTKKYYNQKNVIDEIHEDTGCSIYEISKILNSLGNVVKDKFSDKDDYVEIKLFPGLKVTSRFIPSEQSGLNLYDSGHISSKTLLNLSASFSKDFKNKIHELHRQYE